MTDEAERLLGEINGRTLGILTTVGDIKNSINELFNKSDRLRSDVDTLTAEHKQRVNQGAECNQSVSISPIPKTLLALMGGSGVVGAGIVLVILLLLKKWGFI